MNSLAVGVVPQVAGVVIQAPITVLRTVESTHKDIIRDTAALQEVALEDLTEEQIAQMDTLVATIGDHLKQLRQGLSREGKTGT